MTKLMQLAVIAAATALFSVGARAELIADGDPIYDGSSRLLGTLTQVIGGGWGQGFIYKGYPAVNRVAVSMGGGDPLLRGAFRGFDSSVAGWSTSFFYPGSAPLVAAASGPAVNALGLEIWFQSSRPQPLVFNFNSYVPGSDTPFEQFRAEFNGVRWSIDAGHWNANWDDIVPVPEPGAVLLGASGLALVGWLRRRMT